MKKITNLRWLIMSLLLAAGVSSAWGGDITDELTPTLIGVTGTSYTDWTGKNATSDAVYAGNSAGQNSTIQLRSKNSNSGIVTTTSGGKIKSITVTWNSNTAAGRTIQVYGKHSAYSAATDLYSSSTQGTLLGSITYNSSTSLTVSGDYEYIGIRSADGALYTEKITIVWTESGSTEQATTTTINSTGITNADLANGTTAGSLSATVKTNENIIPGASVTWSSNKESVATVASDGTVTLVGSGTTTITASYAGVSGTYAPSSATYSLTVTDSNNKQVTFNFGYTDWGKTASFSGTSFDEVTQTKDGVTATYTRNNGSLYANNSSLRFYKSNELTFEAPTGYVITSITFTGSNWQNDVTTDEPTCTATTSALSWTGEASSVTFTRPSNASSYATWSSATILLKKISAKLDADLVFKNDDEPINSLSMYVGDEVTLTFTQSTPETVTFTVGNTSIATYNPSTGKVTAMAEGNTTLTATSPANSTYEAGIAVVNITVHKKPHGLAYEPTSAMVVQGSTLDQPTLSNPNTLTLTYTTSDATVATVSNTGVIALAGSTGQAVITAEFAGNSTYEAGSVTFTVNVVSNNTATYNKITSTDELEDGEYLIVYETGNVIFDGSRTSLDATSNNQPVTISSNSIATNIDYEFTIAAVTDGYSIKSHSGKYIGHTGSSNALKTSDTDDYVNSITFDSGGNTVITCNKYHLMFNTSSDQQRFRYFNNTSHGAIQLYKKGSSTPYLRFGQTEVTRDYMTGGTYQQVVQTNIAGVTYSSSNTNVATVAADGTVSFVTVGDVVITATATPEGASEPKTASYTLHIVEPNIELFELVTSQDEIVSGGEYLIVEKSVNNSVKAYDGQNGTSHYAAEIAVTKNGIEIDNATPQANVIVLEDAGDGHWYLKDGDKYLTAGDDNKSGEYYTHNGYLYFNSEASAASKWDINVALTNTTIVNTAYPVFQIKYNGTTSYNGHNFSSYSGVFTYVQLYKKATALADAGIYYETTSFHLDLGDSFTAPILQNPNGVSPITYSSSNPNAIEVNATTGAVNIKRAGSAVITATYAGSALYKKTIATYTLLVSKIPNEGLIFNETFDKIFADGGNDAQFTGLVAKAYARKDGWGGKKPNGSGWDSDWETDKTWTIFDTDEERDYNQSDYSNSYVQAGSQCVKFGGGSGSNKTNGVLSTTFEMGAGITQGTLTFSAAGWGTGDNYLIVTATGCDLTYFSNTGGSVYNSSTNTISLVNSVWNDFNFHIDNVTGPITITFKGWRGFIDEIAVGGPYTVTIGATGYATLYYGSAPLIVPSGVTAYTLHTQDVNGYTDVVRGVTLATGTKIAAGTGVILTGEPGKYLFPFAFENVDANDEDNILKGSDVETLFDDPAYEYFILGKKNDVGFYHQIPYGGKAVKNGAHKAFIQIPVGKSILNDTTSSAAMRGGFSLVDMIATAIERHEQEVKKDNVFYNLAGQRVMNPTKGIYIVNGKKVFIK